MCVARLSRVDRKAVRRYVDAAIEAGALPANLIVSADALVKTRGPHESALLMVAAPRIVLVFMGVRL